MYRATAIRCGLVDFRNHRAALLRLPAEHDLSGSLVVRLCKAGDDRSRTVLLCYPVAVEGDAADRGPGLGQDAVLGAEG